MYLMIDNYDSFVYNLITYFMEENVEIESIRSDKIELEYIDELIKNKKLDGVIISPGPKGPKDYPLYKQLILKYYKQIPILGVCLGHQIIGYTFGGEGTISKGNKPMHGKISTIKVFQKRLFNKLPETFKVTRYHSLIVNEKNLLEDFLIDAKTEDDIVMSISHKIYPLYGIQFHPEAVLTEYGHEIIRNFINLSKNWKKIFEGK